MKAFGDPDQLRFPVGLRHSREEISTEGFIEGQGENQRSHKTGRLAGTRRGCSSFQRAGELKAHPERSWARGVRARNDGVRTKADVDLG